MAKIAYTKTEAAEQVSVSEKTIDRAIKDERLLARKIGSRHIRIDHDDLMDWWRSLPAYTPPRGVRS
jgi:excisionase family DNA binding protein